MNMWEALKVFKEEVEKGMLVGRRIGIRPVSWGKHPTMRFIHLTGVNGTKMFGMCYYNFVAQEWYRTWSVLMPTFYEAYEEWEVVPEDVVKPILKDSAACHPIADNERFIELMINYNQHDERSKKRFERRYRQIMEEHACPTCWQKPLGRDNP